MEGKGKRNCTINQGDALKCLPRVIFCCPYRTEEGQELERRIPLKASEKDWSRRNVDSTIVLDIFTVFRYM